VHRARRRRNGGDAKTLQLKSANTFEETFMPSKQKQPVARKPSKKIADSRRVRYGSGAAPRVLRASDAATKDSRAIRFGSGAAPAALRK